LQVRRVGLAVAGAIDTRANARQDIVVAGLDIAARVCVEDCRNV
jgi:hypothetical protein